MINTSWLRRAGAALAAIALLSTGCSNSNEPATAPLPAHCTDSSSHNEPTEYECDENAQPGSEEKVIRAADGRPLGTLVIRQAHPRHTTQQGTFKWARFIPEKGLSEPWALTFDVPRVRGESRGTSTEVQLSNPNVIDQTAWTRVISVRLGETDTYTGCVIFGTTDPKASTSDPNNCVTGTV